MEFLCDEQGAPAAPGAGKAFLFPLSITKQWAARDSDGRILCVPGIKNCNTADVVANAANTYLTGSSLAVPSYGLQAKLICKWRIFMTKTAAGIAAPVWTIVVGANGTIADTARCTFTGPAQTAVIDTGFVEITAVLRNIGAVGVLAGGLTLAHNLAATGFSNIGSPTLQNTSAGFDTTVANLILGICVNPGSAGVWTHQLVKGEILNG